MFNINGKDLRDFVGCVVEFTYYESSNTTSDAIKISIKPHNIFGGSTYKAIIVFADTYSVHVMLPSNSGVPVCHQVYSGNIINITAAPTAADLLLKEI